MISLDLAVSTKTGTCNVKQVTIGELLDTEY